MTEKKKLSTMFHHFFQRAFDSDHRQSDTVQKDLTNFLN